MTGRVASIDSRMTIRPFLKQSAEASVDWYTDNPDETRLIRNPAIPSGRSFSPLSLFFLPMKTTDPSVYLSGKDERRSPFPSTFSFYFLLAVSGPGKMARRSIERIEFREIRRERPRCIDQLAAFERVRFHRCLFYPSFQLESLFYCLRLFTPISRVRRFSILRNRGARIRVFRIVPRQADKRAYWIDERDSRLWL